MQKLNRIGLIIILALLTLPTTANAESWICEYDNLVREINVVLEGADSVPCSVVYNKEAEGLGSSELWSAKVDGAYCDAKANGLAEKLISLGWTCSSH